MKMTCQTPECGRDASCRGFCNTHYQRAKREGQMPRVSVPRSGSCRSDGCGATVYSTGYCRKHYKRIVGNFVPSRRSPGERSPCSVEGCDRSCHGELYCLMHRKRAERHGDPLVKKKLANGESTPERKRELARKAWRKYSKTPVGRMRRKLGNSIRRLKEGLTSTKMTREQFLELWNQPNCAVCGLPMGDDRTLDHKHPLSKHGTNDYENLQMTHFLCNLRKSNKVPV
jgi:5-methylcytosine-specific restriction endonuclease McrA